MSSQKLGNPRHGGLLHSKFNKLYQEKIALESIFPLTSLVQT